nr:Fe-S protein assembly co-chaperone HscB [Kofleriaceae bacterium]
MDAFGILGLSPRFDVESSVLEQAFFARSKELHPDRFQGAERVAALSRSRALNDAYQTLKKPVPRAEYLLAQAGVVIGDREQLDPEFLMSILELREELANATAAKQTAEVARLEAAMRARRDTAVAALPALFASNDLAGVKKQLIALRYLERYLEACDTALDEDD